MSLTALASLLGGIGLFLLGMSMMTDGLKVAAGDALKSILETWTRSPLRGFLAGFLITAIVQSSSAAIVATVGFVNAGLLTLGQAVWVVIGSNVGTTMTGWLVAMVGIKLDVGALALPLIGIGMLVRLIGRGSVRRAGLGEALAGFGAFFLGIGILQEGFADLSPRLSEMRLDDYTWVTVVGFLGLGVLLTVLTQSSSAAIAITLTASATGSVPLVLAAAAVIGTNIGTTSTAVFAALSATPPARRVATAHILFNLLAAGAALLLLAPLLWMSRHVADWIAGADDMPTTLAVFHTLFNVLGVALLWPLRARFIGFLRSRFVSTEERVARPAYLDDTLASVPSLALRGLVLELRRMTDIAFRSARALLEEPAMRTAAVHAEQVGVRQLGRTVRAFIGKLNGKPLPEDVIAALPDLIRATQHIDELIAASRESAIRTAPGHAAKSAAWEELHAAALASLDLPDAEQVPLPPLDAIARLARQVEESYQSAKSDLLLAAAVGGLKVDEMEQALGYAQALRRVGEVALKTQRRLSPWTAQIKGDLPADTPQASPPSPANAPAASG